MTKTFTSKLLKVLRGMNDDKVKAFAESLWDGAYDNGEDGVQEALQEAGINATIKEALVFLYEAWPSEDPVDEADPDKSVIYGFLQNMKDPEAWHRKQLMKELEELEARAAQIRQELGIVA